MVPTLNEAPETGHYFIFFGVFSLDNFLDLAMNIRQQGVLIFHHLRGVVMPHHAHP